MHITIVGLSFRDDSPPAFFWAASEDPNIDQESILAQAKQKGHGPFDSEDEAERAAQIAIGITPDCEIEEGGMWNPNWSKPQ